MFCRKCGKEIPDDSDFCPKCGTRNVIELEPKGVDLSKPAVQNKSSLVAVKKPYICPECGKSLLSEWQYCPNCMEDNPDYDHSGSENPTNTGLRCPSCGKSLLADWEFCPYCMEDNPHYRAPKPQAPPPATPPPVVVVQPPQQQVIIKEVIKEEPKPEEKGCATWLGEAIGGFITICIILGILGDCLSCAGCA